MTYFIIQIVAEDGNIQYVSKGEYSEFSLTFNEQYAQRFANIELIEQAMKSSDFTKRNIYTDGSSSPPSIIWSGLGICNARKRSSGYINIIKYESKNVSVKPVTDEFID